MINIIPKPNYVEPQKGEFCFSKDTAITYSKKFPNTKEVATPIFDKAKSVLASSNKASQISFNVDDTLDAEEYYVEVGDGTISALASTDVGALYAFMSIRQLLALDLAEEGDIITKQGIRIVDKPHYSYRGFMLDVSRHFSPIDEVKLDIDVMAMLKLNVLHLHLTDCQGWRIEIKKYPLLTEIGSSRTDTTIKGWGSKEFCGEPHSGFYSQEDIKDLIAYAQKRGVMIIPEIDIPAHFHAALAAYPELGCTGEKVEVSTSMGGSTFKQPNLILCAGKEENYQFLFDICDEICDLFPAPYFHIGGDEAPKANWKACPHCQKKIKEAGLKNEEELQAYLNNRIAEHIKTKGKQLMGWNEVLNNDTLNPDTIIQYWTSYRDKRAEKFAKAGGGIVVSKHQAFYIDMSYAIRTAKNVYNYTDKKYRVKCKNILGIEAPLWTEFTRTAQERQVKMFPRLAAAAEVGWTDERLKNYKNWEDRFYLYFAPVLDKFGVWYGDRSLINPTGVKRLCDQKSFHYPEPNLDCRRTEKIRAEKKK